MSYRVVEGKNNKQVFLTIPAAPKATKRGIRQGFFKLGKDLQSTSKRKILEGPKTGRLYFIKQGGRRRRHRASAAGEAPANFSGTLRRSIGFLVKGGSQMEFGSRSGRGADEYAEALEDDRSGRLKGARPYLKPAVKINERNAKLHFTREIKKAIERDAKGL